MNKILLSAISLVAFTAVAQASWDAPDQKINSTAATYASFKLLGTPQDSPELRNDIERGFARMDENARFDAMSEMVNILGEEHPITQQFFCVAVRLQPHVGNPYLEQRRTQATNLLTVGSTLARLAGNNNN
jgi:hypothetical protein